MSAKETVDYGPLKGLIGVWKGAQGVDVAPDPDGIENNPYYETITYTAVGDVTNAESQVLSILHYRQIVQRKSNDEVFHDQTGYWMWDPREDVVMHSLVIPRGVCLLAGGGYRRQKDIENHVIIEVKAHVDDHDWKIIQSPFMQEKARTTEFYQKITVENEKLSYSQTTIVDIYGKIFEHTDENELILA